MDNIPWDTLSNASPFGLLMVLAIQIIQAVVQYRNQHTNPNLQSHVDVITGKLDDVISGIAGLKGVTDSNAKRLEDIYRHLTTK